MDGEEVAVLTLVAWLVAVAMGVVATGYGPELWAAQLPGTDTSLASLLFPIEPTVEKVEWYHIAVAGLFGFVFIQGGRGWYALRYLLTLVHEVGHAFTVFVVGGRPSGIRVHADRSGVAHYLLPKGVGKFRTVPVAFAGDVANGILVLVAAQLLVWVGPSPVWMLLGAVAAKAVLLSRSLLTLTLSAIIGMLVVVGLADIAEPWTFGLAVGMIATIGAGTVYDVTWKLFRGSMEEGSDQRVIREALLLVPARGVMLAQAAMTWVTVAWAAWVLVDAALRQLVS